MTSLLNPLTDEELQALDEFLLDRIDEEEDTEGRDEGLLNVSELDGLFTAIVSGPTLIPPSRWLPALWGDYEPEWENKDDFDAIVTLLMRHMNTIAATLMEAPEEFEPLFMEREADGVTYLIVDEWCEGYMRGVNLAADAWASGSDMEKLLAPIRAFTSETEWEAHSLPSDDDFDMVSDAITPNVRAIHSFWLARRGDAVTH